MAVLSRVPFYCVSISPSDLHEGTTTLVHEAVPSGMSGGMVARTRRRIEARMRTFWGETAVEQLNAGQGPRGHRSRRELRVAAPLSRRRGSGAARTLISTQRPWLLTSCSDELAVNRLATRLAQGKERAALVPFSPAGHGIFSAACTLGTGPGSAQCTAGREGP